MYSTAILFAILAVTAGRSGAAPVPDDSMMIAETSGPFGGGHGPQIVNKGPIFAPIEYMPGPTAPVSTPPSSSSPNQGHSSSSHSGGGHSAGTTCHWTCPPADKFLNGLKSSRGPFSTSKTFTCTYHGGEVCTYDGLSGDLEHSSSHCPPRTEGGC